MNRLKALIWKGYKVRLRSPMSTALDVGGPILIIITYLLLKVVLSSFSGLGLDQTNSQTNLFRNVASKPLDPSQQLPSHLCTKVLFYSKSSTTSDNIGQSIGAQCGIELIAQASRNELVSKLKASLDERIAYKPNERINLSRQNSTKGCFTLPGKSEPSYQAGIVIDGDGRTFEIYSTELAYNPVINQPYTQGSFYNEYRHAQGDLNVGIHLLEICIANAFEIAQPKSQLSFREASNSTGNQNTSSTTTESPPGNNSSDLNLPNNNLGEIKWLIKAFPVTAASMHVPILFLVFQLFGNLSNALATVMRISEDNESGLHHYIRSSGVPAPIYWLSHMAIMIIHQTIQSLVIATLLAIPTSGTLFDPIQDANIATRWLLLLSYSLSITSHALFVGSLFHRTSHAILVTCLLAVNYAMWPLSFIVQWNPYGFDSYSYFINFSILNPVSNYQALLLTIYHVCSQTAEPLDFSHLSMKPIGGSIDWSIGALWALLVIQGFLWFVATILLDQFKYSSSRSPLGLITNLFNEFFLSDCYNPENGTEMRSKTNSVGAAQKMSKSRTKDPHRICCSLRQLEVSGTTVMMAHTRGNPLKMTPQQLERLRNETSRASKVHQYLVNRNQRPSSVQYRATGRQQEEPILLDEAMQQHIVWYQTDIRFENLSLDFRFNQVSFVLGQTDLKELLFASILGLRPLQSGHIVLDGVKYTSATLSKARPHIGFLGERDIFLNEMTIFENLQFFGSLRDPSYRLYDSESLFLLSLLHLTSRKNNMPIILTSRSARKLALATAAVGHTKLLLLVEPTLSLRWKPRCQVLNLLKKYKSIRSIVVDTSDVDEATAFGDRIVLLRNGRADLDGTPEKLSKKLACGHWIVFEPTASNEANADLISNIKSLETLTNELFKQEKLERLEASKRSVYQELMRNASKESATGEVGAKLTGSRQNELHKTTVILKVQHSPNSSLALCSILKMFAQHNVHGFRLSELTFESLEDVMVLRMSKAMYPDLPPDLLLSLQHRSNTATDHESNQVSVRKLSSELRKPKSIKPMFGAKMVAIFKDRASAGCELVIMIISFLIALLCVTLALWSLQISLKPGSSGASTGQNLLNDGPLKRPLKQWNGVSLSDTSSDGQLINVEREGTTHEIHTEVLEHYSLEELYKNRIGFYVIDATLNDSSTTSDLYLSQWDGNKNLIGIAAKNMNESDAVFVASLIQESKDLLATIIFFDPQTNEAHVVFEPHLPHALLAGIKTFINYKSSLGDGNRQMASNKESLIRSGDKLGGREDNSVTLATSFFREQQLEQQQRNNRLSGFQHNFPQSWHEMLRGHLTRRFFYGIGFAIAEGIAMGALVLAPVRHRSESRAKKVRTTYWLAMALFDLTVWLFLLAGYMVVIIIFEQVHSFAMMTTILLVLLLYKIASLPIAYLVSLVVESSLNGFFFIILTYITFGWVFSVHLKSFVEWTLYGENYLYIIASWIILMFPISSLIASLTNIVHISRSDQLCDLVPAYATTSNVVPIDGVQRIHVIDTLFENVRECLKNGKGGISTNVMHEGKFGIIWEVCLIIVFGLVTWSFLLFSERVFGILARRFSSQRTSNDPLKTIVRSTEPSHSLFKWDRERDRLVSEYIRCTNEPKYMRQMVGNCLYLRIWLKPMSDQSSIEKRMALILEPLVSSGLTKNDVKIELKTTLQVFIRIGSESVHCKMDRIHLIEIYTKFIKDHSDTVLKFAVVDWTRETLYKILLHGHYNTKSTSAIT